MTKIITPEYLARTGTEHGEQSALFCWAVQNRKQFPQLRWMYAQPNGGGRSMTQGLSLKAEGVKGGVADVFLPVVSQQSCPGLYIEMKKANGIPSDVSAEQLEFGKFVMMQGYQWQVCFGWQQAASLLVCYLTGQTYGLSVNQQKVQDKVLHLIHNVKSDWQT